MLQIYFKQQVNFLYYFYNTNILVCNLGGTS